MTSEQNGACAMATLSDNFFRDKQMTSAWHWFSIKCKKKWHSIKTTHILWWHKNGSHNLWVKEKHNYNIDIISQELSPQHIYNKEQNVGWKSQMKNMIRFTDKHLHFNSITKIRLLIRS